MVTGAYKPRNPNASALYQCVRAHFAAFEEAYPTRYQEQYGFYRPIIGRVVEKFLGCGDITKGFARVRCDTCRHEYLLAFSCKGRYFCPSCHQKRVLQFGGWVTEEILAARKTPCHPCRLTAQWGGIKTRVMSVLKEIPARMRITS